MSLAPYRIVGEAQAEAEASAEEIAAQVAAIDAQVAIVSDIGGDDNTPPPPAVDSKPRVRVPTREPRTTTRRSADRDSSRHRSGDRETSSRLRKTQTRRARAPPTTADGNLKNAKDFVVPDVAPSIAAVVSDENPPPVLDQKQEAVVRPPPRRRRHSNSSTGSRKSTGAASQTLTSTTLTPTSNKPSPGTSPTATSVQPPAVAAAKTAEEEEDSKPAASTLTEEERERERERERRRKKKKKKKKKERAAREKAASSASQSQSTSAPPSPKSSRRGSGTGISVGSTRSKPHPTTEDTTNDSTMDRRARSRASPTPSQAASTGSRPRRRQSNASAGAASAASRRAPTSQQSSHGQPQARRGSGATASSAQQKQQRRLQRMQQQQQRQQQDDDQQQQQQQHQQQESQPPRLGTEELRSTWAEVSNLSPEDQNRVQQAADALAAPGVGTAVAVVPGSQGGGEQELLVDQNNGAGDQLSMLLSLCEEAMTASQQQGNTDEKKPPPPPQKVASHTIVSSENGLEQPRDRPSERSFASNASSYNVGGGSLAPSQARRPSPPPSVGPQRYWELIRMWFKNHQSRADRHDALMNYQGEYGVTCLHLLCRHGDPPVDILQMMLESAPQIADRYDAFRWLPLHHACASGCTEEIVALLVSYSPDSTHVQDRRGRTPLHFALALGSAAAAAKKSQGVLTSSHKPVQQGASGAHGLMGAGADGSSAATDNTALTATTVGTTASGAPPSSAPTSILSPSAIGLLVAHGASTQKDENHMLSLHYACAYGSLCEESMAVLINSYPGAITAVDKQGRTPLHFAMGNADKDASPHTVKTLLEYDPGLTFMIINMFDREGQLPLHLLAIQARRNMNRSSSHDGNDTPMGFKGTGRKQERRRSSKATIGNAASVKGKGPGGGENGNGKEDYQDDNYQQVSNAKACLGLYLEKEPVPSADFLTALQSLPTYLRDYAVTSPHVQRILNDKIAQRFPTAILFIDFYFLVTVIFCFRQSTYECIAFRSQVFEEQSDNDVYFEGQQKLDFMSNCGGPLLIIQYVCATYFFLREIVQALSLWSLGSFRMWLFDPKNWLDVLSFGAVYFFTATMQLGLFFVLNEHSGRDEGVQVLRVGAAITTGLLWGCMISFLKSTVVDFAVFVDGVIFVVTKLVAFLMALSVIVVAFALMFFTVFQNSCDCVSEDHPDFQVCSEQPGFEQDPYFAFCTLSGSLMKCFVMLIGEVDEEIFDSLISKFFYAIYVLLVVILLFNVLIAIVIDSYAVIKNDRAAMVFWSNRLDYVAEMDAISYYYECRTRNEYKQQGPTPGGENGSSSSNEGIFYQGWKWLMSVFQDQDLDHASFEFFFYVLARCFTGGVVIPIWVVMGFATAGALWPPQVREFLLVQKTTEKFKELDQHHIQCSQLSAMKENIKKFKSSVRDTMAADREDLAAFRTQAELLRRNTMEDLTQINEVMKTILEMKREAQAAGRRHHHSHGGNVSPSGGRGRTSRGHGGDQSSGYAI